MCHCFVIVACFVCAPYHVIMVLSHIINKNETKTVGRYSRINISSSMLFAGLAYGVLCIGMAGLASLMGGILQVQWICSVEDCVHKFYFSG